MISVVLPAYNEEDSIEKAARAALEFLPTCFTDHEVLVVDDGSRDATAAVVEKLAREHPTLRLLRHEQNQGYGAAIATGFTAARGELIFYTDSDNQFDIRELKDTVPLLEDADVVFGFRVYRYDSVTRCLLSWIYNRLVRVLFLVKVRDVDCAFKLFKREVVEQLHFESRDFFIDTEMAARVSHLGSRLVEKGVRHYPRTAGSTTVRAGHIPKTLWTVFRMWFRIHFGRRGKPAA